MLKELLKVLIDFLRFLVLVTSLYNILYIFYNTGAKYREMENCVHNTKEWFIDILIVGTTPTQPQLNPTSN